MGFHDEWCTWVKGILQSARSAVLVNGSPTFEFNCEKGVRQGDPLSPILFLIVMEVLHCLLDKAVELGEIKGIRFDDGRTELSHMFYADDALLVGEWSKDNMDNVARVLRVFHLCSGLKINLQNVSFLVLVSHRLTSRA